MTREYLDSHPLTGQPVTRAVCGADHPSGDGDRFCTRSPHGRTRHVNRLGNEWFDHAPDWDRAWPGAIVCLVCGIPVRTADRGAFAVHADPR